MPYFVFRNFPDDTPIPDDCYSCDGSPDWAALLEWICPDLSRDEAERLAVIGEASGDQADVAGLKRLIEAHARPEPHGAERPDATT
ncbi:MULTISPECIES: hypothetical protein [Sorangium]|uniref:Uncharacterized protein n=1 Tax=Sorangium cellulosum TaxID=56 RepID=A0A4P2QXN0_SORCE|nr:MULTISPECIES: hypothetical protein [Sorangium]AUX34946.1 hypothetical protein SOCE836_071260 [Sorangium cellulosum]WCQ94253.1 hypothetical protein NQZ70_07010 [Sorangium sp. Soce836]